MERKQEILLSIDGLINVLLGLLLILFPFGIAEFFGVPIPSTNFYQTILGGVIFGIGIALYIERYGYKNNIRGLGLGGAIVINICGGMVLLIWLLINPFDLPLRGYIILWTIALLVLLVGIIELAAKSWKY
ncbi:MAG: hypothetical protein U9R24_00170 [Thermodesulfobacteriota bacterium]|nr:hypothetical protein [Thermodesulfobacteriota bacterium]